ncbi:cupin domain-containing protein [Angustibacter peucedani]
MSYPVPADGQYPPDRYTGDGGEASARFRPVGQAPEVVGATTSTHYLATGASTGGQFGLYRWDMGPERSGPDPHFHRSISESFFVLQGVVSLHDGTGWRDAAAGDFLHVPEGGVHGFRNESGEPASMLILFAPGAPREDYFETLADTARREAMDDEARAAFFLRHDTFWV